MAKEKIYDVKTWVLLTKEQHQQITAAADRLGLPVGAFIRMAALEKSNTASEGSLATQQTIMYQGEKHMENCNLSLNDRFKELKNALVFEAAPSYGTLEQFPQAKVKKYLAPKKLVHQICETMQRDFDAEMLEVAILSMYNMGLARGTELAKDK